MCLYLPIIERCEQLASTKLPNSEVSTTNTSSTHDTKPGIMFSQPEKLFKTQWKSLFAVAEKKMKEAHAVICAHV